MTTIIILFNIVTLTVLAYLYIGSRNSYEQALEELEKENDDLIGIIGVIYARVYEDMEELKQIDRGGSFRSDDEVGFAFNSIKAVFDDLTAFIEKNINNAGLQEDDGSKEKTKER
jgi:hypothetical protein